MRLCQVVASLESQYGGPSRSVLRQSAALSATGQKVELLATAPHAETVRRQGDLEVEIFARGRPGFLCPSAGLRRRLAECSAEIVHHHGLWLRTLAYCREASDRLAAPLVVSPRGMMGAWAWNHHRLRKQLCSWFVHPGAFEAVRGWHATSEAEAADIRRLGYKAPICVAPNGVESPLPENQRTAAATWAELVPESRTKRVALFYSRLHSKKRVRELIQLWTEIAPRDWLLLVVGIPEEYSSAELSAYANSLGGSASIRVLDGSQLPPPYSIAALFLLPSHNENFGMSIAEAMVNGVPVLVTDATPWSGVYQKDCGWCVSWDDYSEALQSALAENPARLQEMGRRASAWVREEFSWAKSARILLGFYSGLKHA